MVAPVGVFVSLRFPFPCYGAGEDGERLNG